MDILIRHSRRALCGGLLIVASASCEWITPLDFVGNGVDARAPGPEAGGSDAEASGATDGALSSATDGALSGATDGALNPGDGSAESGVTPDADSCEPDGSSNCQACGDRCHFGTECGCHMVAFPKDAGPPDVVASDAKADAASSGDDSSTPPPPPTNLLTNGNFADGTTKWAIVSGTATEAIVAGDLCVAVTAANDTMMIVLGWPEPTGSPGVPLSAAASYTFSYTAHTTQADVTVDATVGDTTGPDYLPIDFESKTDTLTTTATTFTQSFTPASGADASAGISFLFVSNVAQSVCFANVSLVQN